ncbi:LysR family transcriptional regulator [Fusobacterium sp. PH5-44]|uniref:LysR family transcriptional regulator n=1 Tax=unclassified Fusobacterium TaxID=2648384 RepID=UPI003D227A81
MDLTQLELENIHIDTRILRYIVTIVNEKSLTKASEILYISQPNLSRHLKNVETLINAQIFHRRNNKLELTSAGKIFINGARNIIYTEDEMLRKLRTTRQDRQNSVYICAEGLFYDIIKEKIITLYNEKYPDISLFLTKSNGKEIRQLTQNGFSDIGFYSGDVYDDPSTTCESFLDSEFIFCAPENCENFNKIKKIDLSNFLKTEFLFCSDEFIHQYQKKILSHYNIQNPVVSCVANVQILLSLLKNGYGNLIFPAYLLKDVSENRKFSFSSEFKFNGIFVYNNRFQKGKAVKSFIDFIRPYLSEELMC